MASDQTLSTVERLIQQQAEKRKQQDIVIEREKEWKDVVNRLFSTDDGRYFAKYLLKDMRLFTADEHVNPAQEIEDRGRRRFYLKYIRPYLDRDVRVNVENQ